MRVVLNASGQIRRVSEGGREYLVAPISLITPGILQGSKGPLLYTPEDVANKADAWNGVPIVVYHPFHPVTGEHLSASDEGVIERQGIGELRNAKFNGKLRAEGWFDVEKTRKVARNVYDSLIAGKTSEVSTGLYTTNDPAPPGSSHNGRRYTHVAREHVPDHLAILPDQVGACSIADGCGVLVNSMKTDEKSSIWQKLGRMLGINGKSNIRNSLGSGNHSLATRATHANSLTASADEASTAANAPDSHQEAQSAHQEAAKAHLAAATEAAKASSTNAEPDYVAAGYHQQKALQHSDKADEHGAKCAVAMNSSRSDCEDECDEDDDDCLEECDEKYNATTETTGDTRSPLSRIDSSRMVEADERDDHQEDDAPGSPSAEKSSLALKSMKRNTFLRRVQSVYNRAWPQEKRDNLDESNFAGPNQSYPISTQEDVDAASHLIGKAKNPEAIKSRIISIAKRKGLRIPEAWTANQGLHPPEKGDAEFASDEQRQAFWGKKKAGTLGKKGESESAKQAAKETESSGKGATRETPGSTKREGGEHVGRSAEGDKKFDEEWGKQQDKEFDEAAKDKKFDTEWGKQQDKEFDEAAHKEKFDREWGAQQDKEFDEKAHDEKFDKDWGKQQDAEFDKVKVKNMATENAAICPECHSPMRNGACTNCKYTENANPEGHNQYTGKGGSAHKVAAKKASDAAAAVKDKAGNFDRAAQFSGKAAEASKKATGATSHLKAMNAHIEAKEAHLKSAKQSTGKERQLYLAAAKAHGEAALAHSDKALMRNKKMTREDRLKALTVNCRCEEDRVSMNSLSDETLEALMNAKSDSSLADESEDAATKAQMKDKEDEEDNDNPIATDDEDFVEPGKEKKMNMNQWLSLMPDEAREVWNGVTKADRLIKQKLVQRLLVNVKSDRARSSLAAKYVKLSAGELEERLLLLPQSQAQNVSHEYAGSPLYLGMASPEMTSNAEDSERADTLDLPVMNWADAG